MTEGRGQPMPWMNCRIPVVKVYLRYTTGNIECLRKKIELLQGSIIKFSVVIYFIWYPEYYEHIGHVLAMIPCLLEDYFIFTFPWEHSWWLLWNLKKVLFREAMKEISCYPNGKSYAKSTLISTLLSNELRNLNKNEN